MLTCTWSLDHGHCNFIQDVKHVRCSYLQKRPPNMCTTVYYVVIYETRNTRYEMLAMHQSKNNDNAYFAVVT